MSRRKRRHSRARLLLKMNLNGQKIPHRSGREEGEEEGEGEKKGAESRRGKVMGILRVP